jgi:flagellar protein FlaJ
MSLDLGNSGVASQLINTSAYNIPLIEFVLVIVIMFSAMLSSLMIRTVDGGHKINTYVHFVAMAWIASLVSILTRVVVSSFLSV